MNTLGEPCVLQDRSCTQCGECNLCDLDPLKQCDNCCQCINTLEGDFAEIEIDDILVNSEEKTSRGKLDGKKKVFRIKNQ